MSFFSRLAGSFGSFIASVPKAIANAGRAVVKAVTRTVKKTSRAFNRFTRSVIRQVRPRLDRLICWIQQHLLETFLILAVVTMIIVFIARPELFLIGLGFSSYGPVAGSTAAAVQASIGAVTAGSLYAILQSAAMGGYGTVITGSIAAAASIICAAIYAWWIGSRGANTEKNKFE